MNHKSALELDQQLGERLTGERAHTIDTILLIAEIEKRKLFVELGYSSCWNYLRRAHGQSDTMIHYRLSCARAVGRFPQVVEPLRAGRLCMTTLAKLMEVMTEANCDELIAQALGKSTRDARRIVARIKPKPVPQDVTRPLVSIQVASAPAAEQPVQTEILTETLARKHITVDREYEELLAGARAALSHKMSGAAELDILKEGLRRIVREAEKRKGIVARPRADREAKGGQVSQSVKRAVWQRDQGRCHWRTADGGICGSRHQLEFHHRQDRSKGGLGSVENVRLLCRLHNQYAAELSCGEEFMRARRSRRRPKTSGTIHAPEARQPQLGPGR